MSESTRWRSEILCNSLPDQSWITCTLKHHSASVMMMIGDQLFAFFLRLHFDLDSSLSYLSLRAVPYARTRDDFRHRFLMLFYVTIAFQVICYNESKILDNRIRPRLLSDMNMLRIFTALGRLWHDFVECETAIDSLIFQKDYWFLYSKEMQYVILLIWPELFLRCYSCYFFWFFT